MITYNRKIPAKRKAYANKYIKRRSLKSELTNLCDCNNIQLSTGDIIMYNNRYRGVLLYNPNEKCYGIYFGFWYNPFDTMNPESYGKFISIPSDNGARMHIKKVGTVNDD